MNWNYSKIASSTSILPGQPSDIKFGVGSQLPMLLDTGTISALSLGSTSHMIVRKFCSLVPRRTISWERDWNYYAAVAVISIDSVWKEIIYVKREERRAS